MEVTTAYSDGFQAGYNGMPVESNPFSVESVDFTDWDTGHVDGVATLEMEVNPIDTELEIM